MASVHSEVQENGESTAATSLPDGYDAYETLIQRIEADLAKKPASETDATNGDANKDGSGTDEATCDVKNFSFSVAEVDDELDKFTMPSLKIATQDLNRVRSKKHIVVYPLSIGEISSPTIQQVINAETCVEYRLKCRRSNADNGAFVAFLNLYFTSRSSAQQAVDVIKAMRSDLTVEISPEGYHAVGRSLPQWNNEEKANSHLTPCALFIKNVGSDVTVEKLKELFPDADDVVIPREKTPKRSKIPSRLKGYAYILYVDEAAASQAELTYTANRPELDGRPLKVMKYSEPVPTPTGLLSLVERKLVLKHGSKTSTLIERCKTDGTAKIPDQHLKKLQACVKLIEQDNAARQQLGLPTPTFDELCRNKTLMAPGSKKCQDMLQKLGVLVPRDNQRRANSAPHKSGANNAQSRGPKRQQQRLTGPGLLGMNPLQHSLGLLGNSPMAQTGLMNANNGRFMNPSLLGAAGGRFDNRYSRVKNAYGGGSGGAYGANRQVDSNGVDLASSVAQLVNLSQLLVHKLDTHQQYPNMMPANSFGGVTGGYGRGSKFAGTDDRMRSGVGHYGNMQYNGGGGYQH